MFRKEKQDFVFLQNQIGGNVSMENNVMIMPGVTACDNVIIGSGSIVIKSLTSNVVYTDKLPKE